MPKRKPFTSLYCEHLKQDIMLLERIIFCVIIAIFCINWGFLSSFF